MINEIDVVELTKNIPSSNLYAKTRGTVVLVYPGNPPAYEVEFADEEGVTLAVLTLSANDIKKVWDANTKQYILAGSEK